MYHVTVLVTTVWFITTTERNQRYNFTVLLSSNPESMYHYWYHWAKQIHMVQTIRVVKSIA